MTRAAKEEGVARQGMRWHSATSLLDRVAVRQSLEPCHVLGVDVRSYRCSCWASQCAIEWHGVHSVHGTHL